MAENLERLALWQKKLSPLQWRESEGIDDALQEYLSFYGLDFRAHFAGLDQRLGFVNFSGLKVASHLFLLPKEKSKGLVFVQHGYTDHVGLFIHVIRGMLAMDYSVVAYDLPGHGLSEGERATIDSFTEYKSLFEMMLGFTQEHFTLPFHIVAQSMGAAITMDWLLSLAEKEAPVPVEKVVLFAPLVRPHGWRFGRIAYHAMKKITSGIVREFGENSEDKVFLDFVKSKDPLQHERLPTRWVGALDEWVVHFESLPESDFPLYIIQGRKDMTVDWKYNINHIEHKFHNTLTHYVTDAGHHLANESARLRKDIFAYLEAAFQE